MTSNATGRTVTALVTATLIFLVAVVLPKFVITEFLLSLGVAQGLELVLALLAIAVLGKGKFAEYGFRTPAAEKNSALGLFGWMRGCIIGVLLGMAASIAMLGLGGNGNPVAKQLNLYQLVLFVWIFSSTIEEVFTRGFLQGHLSALSGKYVKLLSFQVEWPVLISALFFASMHLILPFGGADTVTTVVIWLFTFSLGLLAASLRAKTGSLFPPIVVHMLANIGGMIGGMLYTVVSFVLSR